MTLTINSTLKARRKYLQIKLWDRRLQLLTAYESNNPDRIVKAKLSLARILRELAESPELGPRRRFDWGKLWIIYAYNFDPVISWQDCEATEGDMHKVAHLLERSVFSD